MDHQKGIKLFENFVEYVSIKNVYIFIELCCTIKVIPKVTVAVHNAAFRCYLVCRQNEIKNIMLRCNTDRVLKHYGPRRRSRI